MLNQRFWDILYYFETILYQGSYKLNSYYPGITCNRKSPNQKGYSKKERGYVNYILIVTSKFSFFFQYHSFRFVQTFFIPDAWDVRNPYILFLHWHNRAKHIIFDDIRTYMWLVFVCTAGFSFFRQDCLRTFMTPST